MKIFFRYRLSATITYFEDLDYFNLSQATLQRAAEAFAIGNFTHKRSELFRA